MTRGLGGFARDNLEAFAVAIAMALVIRHYCLEAFRIPTRSMMPTLVGDEAHGDRILVDKAVYLRRDPERFEVVVFEFPLNRARNYIKRLVGLPGEWLRVVDGDVWTSTDGGVTWRIRRKPPGTREDLLFPYYPEPLSAPRAFRERRSFEADEAWLVSERDHRFRVDAEGSATLRFDRRLLAYDDVDVGSDELPWVGDARVSFDLAVERAGELVVRVQEHGLPHRLVLAPEGSRAIVAGVEGETAVPLDVRLEDGMELHVSFANVDDTLVVRIEGDEDVELDIPFPNPPGEPPVPEEPRSGEPDFDLGERPPRWWDHEIALEARGLAATVEDLRIDRDLYYNADSRAGVKSPYHVWKIPDDHFLMFGDNTRASSDSRVWKVVRVTLDDGRVVEYQQPGERDAPDNPYKAELERGGAGEVYVEKDIDGLVQRFERSSIVDVEETAYPFVPRSHLVGRAFAIFWPIYLPRIYPFPTRVDLIR